MGNNCLGTATGSARTHSRLVSDRLGADAKEIVVTVALVVALAGWLAFSAVLSWFMAHRGYDRSAWLVVSLLLGPVALVLVVDELLEANPRRPDTIKRAQPGSGEVDMLVIPAGDELGAARLAMDAFGHRLRRLVVARVLPYDGPTDFEAAAVHRLRRDARALARPSAGLAVLFGPPARAIADFAVEEGFTVVVTERDTRGLAARLGPKIVLLSGCEAVTRFNSRDTASRRAVAGQAA
jgi:hypothetical protein